MSARRTRVGLAVGIAATLTLSAGAVEDWRSEAALGDVVVSFDGFVRVYDNAATGPIAAPKGDDLEMSGGNRGLAFDAGLTLLVANSTSNSIVKLNPATPHASSGSTATQPNPQSVVVAADGTVYVASRDCTTVGTTTTCTARVRRVSPGSDSVAFSVPIGSGATCVGIDLDPDQSVLYIVDGATASAQRRIHTLNVATNGTGSIGLPGSGAACGIRALPPARFSGAGSTNGGFLVADRVNVKRISSAGQLQASFVTTLSTETNQNKKPNPNWIDVDLDPNTFDFWAVNDGPALPKNSTAQADGETLLARFRLGGGPGAVTTINTFPDRPKGVTLNGALRAAQTVQLLGTIQSNLGGPPSIARFLQGTIWEHSWAGSEISTPTPYAVQVFEVTSDGEPAVGEFPTSGACPPSLDVDCRVAANFPAAVGKGYSRGRKVVYREIPLQNTNPELRIGFIFPDLVALPGSGEACTSTSVPQPATAALRDPYPHDLFSLDATIAVYPGDTGVFTRSNDTIVADRYDALYVAHLRKPTAGTRQNQGSTMQVELQVRAPGTCTIVSSLSSGELVLTATDVTGPEKGTPVADSEGLFGSFTGNGISWTFLASVYRTNVYIDPALFAKGRTYKFCVNSKVDPLTGTRAIGEVCQDVEIK